MAKKTFFVHEPLQHDGESFPVGSKIALEVSQADGLLAAGVISTAPVPVIESTDESTDPVVTPESPAE